MADTAVAEAPVVETPAEAAPEHPGAPTLAQEIEAETAKLNNGLTIAKERGFMSRREVTAPRGAVSLKAQRAAAAPAAVEQAADEPETPAAPAAPGKPAAPAKPDQPQLSAGFGKLARKERQLTRREAELETRAAQVKAAEEAANARLLELQTKEKAWEPKVQTAEQVTKLLEADEYDLLQAVAEKKGTTAVALFNRLTKRMANAGKIAPEDAVAAVNDEVAKLKAELAKRDEVSAAEKAKAEADAKAAREKTAKDSEAAAATAREKAYFVQQVKASADKYPLLAKEDPTELGDVAHALALDFLARNGGRVPPNINDLVAAHLEKVLAYEEYQKNQTTQTNGAGAKPATPEPAKPAKPAAAGPSARGNGAASKTAKPEAVIAALPKTERPKNGIVVVDEDDEDRPGPATLTNQLGSERTSSRRADRRSDRVRLEEAAEMWERSQRQAVR